MNLKEHQYVLQDIRQFDIIYPNKHSRLSKLYFSIFTRRDNTTLNMFKKIIDSDVWYLYCHSLNAYYGIYMSTQYRI